MKPIISVQIPCYNRSDLLRECVESFINQTYKLWELILIDDGSSQDISFVKDMDSRIKYFRQPHLGISKAFNLAIDKSSGQYFLPMGSDDTAEPNLLGLTLEAMERHKRRNYHMVFTDQWQLRADGSRIRKKHPHAHQIHSNEECYKMMLERQFIAHGGTLWMREKAPRYDESLSSAVDLELFLTALEQGVNFYHVPLRLWTYRTGGHEQESMSKRQNECCDIILRKRGYTFNPKTRRGEKL